MAGAATPDPASAKPVAAEVFRKFLLVIMRSSSLSLCCRFLAHRTACVPGRLEEFSYQSRLYRPGIGVGVLHRDRRRAIEVRLLHANGLEASRRADGLCKIPERAACRVAAENLGDRTQKVGNRAVVESGGVRQ